MAWTAATLGMLSLSFGLQILFGGTPKDRAMSSPGQANWHLSIWFFPIVSEEMAEQGRGLTRGQLDTIGWGVIGGGVFFLLVAGLAVCLAPPAPQPEGEEDAAIILEAGAADNRVYGAPRTFADPQALAVHQMPMAGGAPGGPYGPSYGAMPAMQPGMMPAMQPGMVPAMHQPMPVVHQPTAPKNDADYC
jgi:hypothetical protein